MSTGEAESQNTEQVEFRNLTDYVDQFIGDGQTDLLREDYKSFRIFYQKGSYAESQQTEIKSGLNNAYSRILDLLGERNYPFGINLLFLDSREEMNAMIGRPIKGGAVPGHDFVYFVYNDAIRPYLNHELFHLMAYELWGPSSSRFLDEGGATYADGVCHYENPMYSINAGFLKDEVLFPAGELISNFDALAAENDVIAYIQAAGYFKFLYERYGMEKMKLLWTSGFNDFENIYGFPFSVLEREWLGVIELTEMPDNFDIKMLMEKGCG